jgi:hypothetical protein
MYNLGSQGLAALYVVACVAATIFRVCVALTMTAVYTELLE